MHAGHGEQPQMQHFITGSQLTHIFRCRNHMILFLIKTITWLSNAGLKHRRLAQKCGGSIGGGGGGYYTIYSIIDSPPPYGPPTSEPSACGLKYYLKPIRYRYKAKLTKLNTNKLSSHKSKSIYGLFHKQQYTDYCKSQTENSCIQLVYMYMSRCLPFNYILSLLSFCRPANHYSFGVIIYSFFLQMSCFRAR